MLASFAASFRGTTRCLRWNSCKGSGTSYHADGHSLLQPIQAAIEKGGGGASTSIAGGFGMAGTDTGSHWVSVRRTGVDFGIFAGARVATRQATDGHIAPVAGHSSGPAHNRPRPPHNTRTT